MLCYLHLPCVAPCCSLVNNKNFKLPRDLQVPVVPHGYEVSNAGYLHDHVFDGF